MNKEKIYELRIDEDDELSGIDSISLVEEPAIEINWIAFKKEKFQEECPIATKDIEVNLKNRQKAINIAHYGPLNPNEPNEDYWLSKARMFGGDVEAAKKARCGNCSFFVKTKQMLDCISQGIGDKEAEQTIEAGDLGYCEAFDFKCAALRTCDAWVVGGPIEDEELGYDVTGLPSFVDPGTKPITGQTKNNFKSYSDYPDSVKNNAKAVLKWTEENGWGSCGTPVGKQRANQLANGEPISEDTIKRMYSYLSRHEKDLESSKGYGDGCGKLMYDSWGGKTALSWAESKIKSIEREKMSKVEFKIDSEEKRTIVGCAMVPNKKIFRKDSMGNPYYVMFREEEIAKIMRKYMRNKYTDNNDLDHDGKAVKDVYVIESWIVEDEQYDKSRKYGFEVPVGSWMVTMKVAETPTGDLVWEKVKKGELNGFSVSGYFEEVAQFSREEMFLEQVVEILKKYE